MCSATAGDLRELSFRILILILIAIKFVHYPVNMFIVPFGFLAGANRPVGMMIYTNRIPLTFGKHHCWELLLRLQSAEEESPIRLPHQPRPA